MRLTGAAAPAAVVCVDGGSRGDVPGTWSATLEWLVSRLARTFETLALIEVRYRIKSWNRLGMCTEDTLAAIDASVAAGARRVALIGFSMGGAVSIGAAGHPAVSTVIGLAPWIPDRLPLSGLTGRRLAIIHGTLDRWLPGIPGVSTASSRRGYERARAAGIEGSYTLVSGGLHGLAVRAPWGGTVRLPRALRFSELVAAELERCQASA
jgi:pimeloyl-ACP methyl ester carboxylesterase